MRAVTTVMALLATGAGLSAGWLDHDLLTLRAPWLLGGGLVALALLALRSTYRPQDAPWPAGGTEPVPLRLGPLDYLRVPICWLDAFKRTWAVRPGLYYTGERYDRDAPLLVTSNYLLTVFLVVWHARAFGVRLLVVDTGGINVWCAAGKGQFSNAAIETQLERYDRALLTDRRFVRLVLPKFGLAGVDLRALRKAKIHPVIGPLYARDLPAFLAQDRLKDRDEDRVHFGLQMRLFSWLPGLVQYVGYALGLLLVLFGVELASGIRAPLGVLAIAALLGTAYPLLFPWLPGVRFAIKGLWLGGLVAVALVAGAVAGRVAPVELAASVPFTLASSLFVALSYTGNSAVSNYSRVRKEIARFLPIEALLYAVSLAAFLVVGLAP